MPSPQSLDDADRRLVAAWAAECAERVLALFEAEAPGDDRPREAIARARAYARGELDAAGEIKRRFVAGRAAHAVTGAAAIAAARSAAQAAGVAHMGAHALGAAAYAAVAADAAIPGSFDGEIDGQLALLAPDARAALRLLPAVGGDASGPLVAGGLLARGRLGEAISRIQAQITAAG
ncbi:putative immunity protein [Microbacterium binotii]|uniref:putative immunity protein n=1 Tax=Microbacterium binotii TaxID=462710 RepID=UPI001F2D4B18|nr:hypothetical protein [Microbacterium binotii]UIN30484.1 hypothetical protein LXM64_15270 [Microbacterium binotii]